jgi:hypothetical protein
MLGVSTDPNMSLAAKNCPRWISRLAPLALALIIILIAVYWVRTSHQPLIDSCSFRQCQTAVSARWFDFKHPIQGFFNYETPELGTPWRIPFEFPLYQAIVAGISQGFGTPLIETGRIVSGLMFLLSLIPLYSLTKGLQLGKRFFYIATIFLIFSPLYLYWSRTFLIESTAVFLGFAFLACVERAVSTSRWSWWGLALFLAVPCALVKVTTFPAFGVAAGGIVFFKQSNFSRASLPGLLRRLGILCAVGIITVICTELWTTHADALKSQNAIGLRLTSERLSKWNYGTFSQKVSPAVWQKIVWDRTLPEVFGSTWGFGFCLAAATACRGRNLAVLLAFVGLFLLPILLFTNLHWVHAYYQYANAFWLILAAALAITVWSRKCPFVVNLAATFLIVATQLSFFYSDHYHVMEMKSSPALDVAAMLRSRTSANASVIVFGDDWAPDIAFHSGRRAFYLPTWVTLEACKRILTEIKSDPRSHFGEYPLEAIITNSSRQYGNYRNDVKHVWDEFRNGFDSVSNEKIKTYEVQFLEKPIRTTEQTQLKDHAAGSG